MQEKTVFDVEQRVKHRKWFDFGSKDRVVVDRGDYDWLKDEASKVVGMQNDLERLRAENARLMEQLKQSGQDRRKAQSEVNRQKGRNQLVMNIIKDHGLYDEFLEKIEEIKAKRRKKEEDDLTVV